MGHGIAVAVDTPAGLATPTLPDPVDTPLAELAAAIDAAIETTREGRPSGSRAIATVSNYGSLNITWATQFRQPIKVYYSVRCRAEYPSVGPARQSMGTWCGSRSKLDL